MRSIDLICPPNCILQYMMANSATGAPTNSSHGHGGRCIVTAARALRPTPPRPRALPVNHIGPMNMKHANTHRTIRKWLDYGNCIWIRPCIWQSKKFGMEIGAKCHRCASSVIDLQNSNRMIWIEIGVNKSFNAMVFCFYCCPAIPIRRTMGIRQWRIIQQTTKCLSLSLFPSLSLSPSFIDKI